MPGAEAEADFFLAVLQTFICLQPKQIFFNLLFDPNLPAKAAFFSVLLQKIPCQALQKLPYLWPNLRLQLF